MQHIALAINDELGLQNRLLDELEEEVEVHESRVKAATAKVQGGEGVGRIWGGGGGSGEREGKGRWRCMRAGSRQSQYR